MNKIEILGRLTKDVEVKKSKNDKSFITFSIAVPRKMNKDITDFIDCIAFGKIAESIYKYTEKGNRIMIIGELHIDNYTDNEGKNKKSISVMVEDFYFLDFKKELSQQKDKNDNQISFK